MMILVAAAALALAPMTASAARVFIGGGAGFYGPGFYGPGFYGPGWGPAYAVRMTPPFGEVKIDTKVKDAEVFVNGAFAGSTRDSKTVRLAPGTYDIEVRQGGQDALKERVFVSAGKTLHLHPAI